VDNIPVPAPTMWRPLGFGEIFDRAITLYFKNFLRFISIALVLAVPLGIIQYFVDTFQSGPNSFWAQMQHLGTAPATPAPTLPAIFHSPGALAALIAGVLIAIVVISLAQMFVYNAAAVGVARLYAGKPVEFRACYLTVLRRWAPILGTLLMIVLVYLAGIIATVILGALFFVPAVQLASSAPGATALLGVLGFLVIVAAFGVLIVFSVATSFALYAVVIEDVGVMQALSSGFSRAFSRRDFWRAMGLVICSGLIAGIGVSLISGVAQVALYYNQAWLGAMLTAIAQLLVIPFSVILMAVFYYDIRIRREGLDLQTSVERLVAGDASPA
jgi:hypothetical protein